MLMLGLAVTLGWPSEVSPAQQSSLETGEGHDCPNSSVWRLLLAGGVRQNVSQLPVTPGEDRAFTAGLLFPAWNNCPATALCSHLGPRCLGCQGELETRCSWGFGLFCPGMILLSLSHLVASSSIEQFKCCLPPRRQSQLSDD